MSESLTIVFAGTPDFAVPALRALLGQAPHRLTAVYTQPDRPAGRGRKLSPSPVKRAASEHGLPVLQPDSFRHDAAVEQLRALQADLMVVAAYGLLLPRSVLGLPRLGCVNIHASVLPRWRGAAPIQRAILAGDEASGVTIMQMDPGLDTGPILHVRRCSIEATDTAADLHDRLATLGAQALVEILPAIAAGSATARPQENAKATYAKKLSKSEAEIDWQESSAVLDRQVRAFNPWPVAFTHLAGKLVRVWSGHWVDLPAAGPPGAVLASSKQGIDVATGAGVYRITRLQLPGGKSLTAADFLNAHSLQGARFG